MAKHVGRIHEVKFSISPWMCDKDTIIAIT